MPDGFSKSVEQIEVEAEKILQQAKAKATEIIIKAREEAVKALTGELPLDDVKVECKRIINEADSESKVKIGNAGKEAAEIKHNAEKNLDKVAKNIAAIVMGTE